MQGIWKLAWKFSKKFFLSFPNKLVNSKVADPLSSAFVFSQMSTRMPMNTKAQFKRVVALTLFKSAPFYGCLKTSFLTHRMKLQGDVLRSPVLYWSHKFFTIMICYNAVFWMKKCTWNLPQLAVRNKFGHHIISNSWVALPSVSLHITLLIEVGRFDRLFWKPAKPDALAIAFARGFLGLKFCGFVFL